jgi:hypothetical protein
MYVCSNLFCYSILTIWPRKDIIHHSKLFLLQVDKTAERIRKEVGNVTVMINCCNLPTPRVRAQHPAPDIRKTLDIGVMSHFWVSLKRLVSCHTSGRI